MRSILALTLLLVFIVPSMALSTMEQTYIDGVNDGLKLGQLVNNVDQYNIAIQQFDDNLNQTFSGNASKMWLPKMATNNNAIPTLNSKPVHKIDGSSPVLEIGGSSVKVHIRSNIESVLESRKGVNVIRQSYS